MSHQLHLNEDQKTLLNVIWDSEYKSLMSGKDKNGIPYLKHVFDLHFEIFGEVCSNCPSKISGYIQKLKTLKNNTMQNENQKESQFELHNDVMIPVAGTSEAYTQHNLTDEIALKLLHQNPNRKVLFRKLPEDIDTLIEEYAKQIKIVEDTDPELVTIGQSKVTIEEAQKLLELVGLKTRATTVNGIDNKILELTTENKAELEKLASDFVAKK